MFFVNGEHDITSVAIETSCRAGGVALGLGGAMVSTASLGPSGRHAAELLASLDELLCARGLGPGDLEEVYISVGPGSFTGLRVGITAARTIGQAKPSLKIVAVPTPAVVAENLSGGLDSWQYLGVMLAAKRPTTDLPECTLHATLFRRDKTGLAVQVDEATLASPGELLARWPRPLLLSGEGLEYADIPPADDIQLAPARLRLPSVENVWRLGWRLARAGQFTPYQQLLPLYARRPEALRLWEQRQGRQ
jgi:tRNA threonylcarbamoyladenosine biosynthesis protein TsaB